MGRAKKFIALVALVLTLFIPMFTPALASADITGTLCGAATSHNVDAGSVNCQAVTSGSETHFQNILSDIINIFSVIVGIVAVLMIIFAGFKYITSGGNQESVKSAKQALIYAIIGLVIVALAQIIVRFVIHETVSPTVTSAHAGQSCSATAPDPPGFHCQCVHDESGTTCTLVPT